MRTTAGPKNTRSVINGCIGIQSKSADFEVRNIFWSL
jgi:hypothetical protein